MPPWVERNEILKNSWEELLETIKNAGFINETNMLPHMDPALPDDENFDKMLEMRKQADIDSLIEESRKEMLEKMDSGEPENRLGKKESLVRDLNIVGDVLNDIYEIKDSKQEQRARYIDLDRINLIEMDSDRPQDGRILTKELPKVLQLNNDDPKTYNLIYWAKFFNIEPEELMNVFNYVSYPIVDEESAEVVKILRFVSLST